MNQYGLSSLRAVEVLCSGQRLSPVAVPPILSSRSAGWNGVVLESFRGIPSSTLSHHEHPTHYLNLFTAGCVSARWLMDGHARSANHGPGTLYLLPAGTFDQVSWSGTSNRVVFALEPQFVSSIAEESADLRDLELRPSWMFEDRHVTAILQALLVDLEDGSPAGPLFGQSLSVAITHSLIRRFGVNTRTRELSGGMPGARLKRVIDFMQQNCGRETHLWELAGIAEMSPHYFCELFKRSTGITPHQYSLRCRIQRAKELLCNRHLAVAQVAAATGFADQSHFTKVFRRVVGVTPVRFRS